jgi:hypothetical protein
MSCDRDFGLISQYYLCEYSSQRPEVITRNFIDGFITNNFRLLSAPNKKAFPNVKYLINIKKMDDTKEAMKYTDHDQLEFYTSILAWRMISKNDQDE